MLFSRPLVLFLSVSFVFGLSVSAQKRPQAVSAFRQLSFEQAQAKGKTENKIVLVDFFTTWCGPCKLLDRTTWKDPKVRGWIQKNAVAIKLDAEIEETLARRYKVQAYPTVLLLKADGTEIDRLVGYRPAADFLTEAEAALSGKDSIARAREKLKGKENNPSERMQVARVLAQKEKYPEALEELLWCYDHGLEHSPAFVGVRLSFLLGQWQQLAKSYPPAGDAMKQRRATAEAQLLAGKGTAATVRECVALCKYGEDPAYILKVYDQVSAASPEGSQTRRVILEAAFDQFLEARRHQDFATHREELLPQADQLLKRYEEMQKNVPDFPGTSKEEFLRQIRLFIVEDCAKRYEALLLIGEMEKSRQLADKILALDASGSAYGTLIEHAGRAGKSEIAQQLAEQGRKTVAPKDQSLIDEALAKISKKS